MTKSWRDVLPIYPAAELFPLMSPDELRALGEDIKKDALRVPVTIWAPSPDSNKEFLLDGRSRLDGMEAVGIQILETKWKGGVHQLLVPYRRLYGKDGGRSLIDGTSCTVDPYAYVISANIHRRHLTAEQKRELIAKLIKATPEKSDRQIAETVKASPTTVGTVRAKMETKGDVSKLDTRTDTKGREQPAKKSHLVKVPKAAKPPRGMPKRDDIGPASSGEIARKDAEIEELRNAKRRLEIENTGLRSEIAELKAERKPAAEAKSAARCDICHEKKRALLRPVFICDSCAYIHELDATPSADDWPDLPASLRRAP